MRILIIVTRKYVEKEFSEFRDYWGGKNNTPIVKTDGDHKLMIVNGEEFRDDNYMDDGFGNNLFNKVKDILDQQKTNNPEIGVIAHGGDVPNVNYLQTNGYNIAFNKPYSTLTPGLCQEDFRAPLCEGTLPLDRLRDCIADNCHKSNEEFNNAFDAVWNFFFGDPLLEAKLELLHACLTPEGRDRVTWSDSGEITITREGQEPFKGRIPDNKGKVEFEALKAKTDGPFGMEYMDTLAALRDALLPEHEYA